MAEEIAEAIQIIRVAYDGIEIAMKVGSGGINIIKKTIEILIGLLDYEKSIGKVNMRKLLTKGGDLQVFQFNADDFKKVKKMAKKYGILYSVLPQINKEQGKMEIVFHTEAVPRVNMLIQNLKLGRIASFDEYLKEGGGRNAQELTKFLEKEKNKGNLSSRTDDDKMVDSTIDSLIEKVGSFAMEKDAISADTVKDSFDVTKEQAENVIGKLEVMGVLSEKNSDGMHKVIMDRDAYMTRIKGYRHIADRIKAVSRSKNVALVDITLNKSLITEENDLAIKTRVPGTWGDNVRYLWIAKENVMEIHEGKTILTFIDKEKDYKLYDENNRVAEMKKGETLYSNHYDSVEIGVRQRYDKMKKDKEKREKQFQEAIAKLTGENKKAAADLNKANMLANRNNSGGKKGKRR